MTPGPGILELVLTASCNLSCAYCYQDDKMGGSMSWETARAGLDRILDSDQRQAAVSFYGGEPLLRFALIRRSIEYASNRRPEWKSIRYTLTTNGMLLDREILDFLEEHDVKLHLSSDGVPEAQALRGERTFQRLDRLLDEFRQEHRVYFDRRLAIGVTFGSATMRHLPASLEYFLRKGVQEINIGPLITHDPGWAPASIEELDGIFEQLADISLRHFHETNRIPLMQLRGGEEKTIANPAPRPMCGAGSGGTLAVDVDGNTSGCMILSRSFQKFPSAWMAGELDVIRMGSVTSSELPRRLRRLPQVSSTSQLFSNKQDKHSSYGKCGECRYLADCGVCPVSVGHIPTNRDPDRVPDLLCAYNLVYLKHRDRFAEMKDPWGFRTGTLQIPSTVEKFLDIPPPASGFSTA